MSWDKIYQFLLGLNEAFVTIRRHILSFAQLLIMSKVFYLVTQEEKQKLNYREKATFENSAYFAKRANEKSEEKKGMFSKSGKKIDTTRNITYSMDMIGRKIAIILLDFQ